MAEPSSGKDEPEVRKSNSFTKLLTSPGSENSLKKKSSNPLTKLLRRKSSKRGEDKGEEASSRPSDVDSEPIEEEDEEDESLGEEVKEVVETVSRDLFHHEKKDTPIDPTTDAAISTKSRDKSSSSSSSSSEEDTKERKHDFLGKFKVGFGKAKAGLKEEYGKAKEEIKSALLNKEKTLAEQHHQSLDMKKMPEISAETPIDEVKAPNLVQRIQEEVVAIVSTVSGDMTKGKTPVPQEKTPDPQEESNEIKEEKKEDNCVSSLAKGLQSFCSWGSKKED